MGESVSLYISVAGKGCLKIYDGYKTKERFKLRGVDENSILMKMIAGSFHINQYLRKRG